MKDTIGAIILAAGNSARMGKCKFLLPMSNGLTFFENIIYAFSGYGIKKIVVVTQVKYMKVLEEISDGFEWKPKFVINSFPEKERFYSLQLGIEAMGNVQWSFIHNADTPFVDSTTLGKLEANKNKADYICPVHEERGGHPILLGKDTLQYLLNSPSNGILSEVLRVKSRYNVPVNNALIMADIDTKEDYRKYFSKR